MFNKLESVISGKQPCTPVLGCRISRALDTPVVGETVMLSDTDRQLIVCTGLMCGMYVL